MSFFVSRAVSPGPSEDRADIFARGEAAVLVVADGAGGHGDGAELTESSPRLGAGREAPRAEARRELAGRLVVASDGRFRHAADDVAVLVAER